MNPLAELSGTANISLGERLGAVHRQLLQEIPQVDRIGCALYGPGEDTRKGSGERGQFQKGVSERGQFHKLRKGSVS